nr:MAG TPA: hypothetical protein [Bacteriophage sp.]
MPWLLRAQASRGRAAPSVLPGQNLEIGGQARRFGGIKSHKSGAFAGAKAELYREQARKLRIENDREENRC